jgi:hypothetical protein
MARQQSLSEKGMSSYVAKFFHGLFPRRIIEMKPVCLPEKGLAIVRVCLEGSSIAGRKAYLEHIAESIRTAKDNVGSEAKIILMAVRNNTTVDIITWTDEELAAVGLARIVEAQP